MNLNKQFFNSDNPITYLQDGKVGGKAKGLEFIQETLLTQVVGDEYAQFELSIPKMLVLRTDVFDAFMKANDLYDIALSNRSDDQISLAFQKAVLPFNILGPLRELVLQINNPLVVRSSSLLEDAMHEPFAGIYGTKMTPNNQFEVDIRFLKLIEAIKFVYASTFFKVARDYIMATKYDTRDEKMAIIIQEVMGKKIGDKFYPEISGVCKSYNYYPSSDAKPKDGVVNLALGLGKQIVDGGVSWSYSPTAPSKAPPFKSVDDLLKNTQLKYWSINLGKLPKYDPINEAEFLVEKHISNAEKEGTLKHLISTFDPNSNRIWDGQVGKGGRILTFAPILKHNTIALNTLVSKLMKVCQDAYKCPVEIEFAVSLAQKPDEKHRFGFLQVRPMVVSDDVVDVEQSEIESNNKFIYSDHVLGNGEYDNICDIVFMKRQKFDAEKASKIVNELEAVNKYLLNKNRNYVLVGFGRWGSTDPWAGIPVNWGQISGAKVIVESSIEGMNQQMSQASHFFHNVSSFKVLYFSIPGLSSENVDWEWLEGLEIQEEYDHICHVELNNPLKIKVDGRTGIGIILK